MPTQSQYGLCYLLSIPQVLYMSNNNVKDWGEFQKLAELPLLEDLLFVGRWTKHCTVFVVYLCKKLSCLS